MRNWIGSAILLFAGASALAAQAVADRVNGEIDTLRTVQLAGTANPHAQSANDIGRLAGDTKLAGITLHFALTAAQKADLDALVQAQQTPGSPYYHQWLTPATFAARYGISDNDLAKVENWLQQQGFSIEGVATSRTYLTFSGTAAQVEAAFGTQMHHYAVNGETHFANASALSIPAVLSGVVDAVRNLNDFRPKPHVRIRPASQSMVNPYFTSSQSGSHYLTPGDVATIYDINAAYSAGYTGSGQSIAVMGQSEIVVTDIEAFQSAAGLTVKDPTLVLVPGSGTAAVSTGDESESDLDLEYSGAIAKGATIYLVYVGNNTNQNVWDSLAYAIDNRIAPILSISYGGCEAEMSQSEYASLDAYLEQGASQGQSIVASAGDSGSTGCYGESGLTTAQQEVVSVNYPASSAYVTALGGTEFPSADTASSNSTYWNSANASNGSSAKSYIPEQVWNDDSSTNGLSSGGGGTSVFATRPSWQKGVPGITTAPDYSLGYRLVPDISLDSSPNDAGYLYCSSDTKSTGITGSCSNGFRDTNNQYLTVAGGTSFAAPIFAGMLAIVNQKEDSTGQGLINSTLYTLASNSSTYASAFHDITSGSNACTAGSTYCSTAGAAEYSATTGYDEATGLGSLDFNQLLNAWPSSTNASLITTTTTLSATTSTPASGAADSITIAVAAASGTPTGTLSVEVDGTVVNSALQLVSGQATYSFSSTAGGVHTIVATYSGSATDAPSTGTVVVTVPATTTTGNGGNASTTVTVAPSGGFTGTVAFDLSTSSTYLQNYACYTISSASVTGSSSVNETLTIYLGANTCATETITHGSTKAFHAPGTRSAAASQAPAVRNLRGVETAGFSAAALLLAGLIGWRFRRVRGLMAVLAFALVGFAVTGCGGSSSGGTTANSEAITVSLNPTTITISSGTSGVPTGSYSIQVEGAALSNSSIYSTATLAVTVD
jgi:subtilase family serine protease